MDQSRTLPTYLNGGKVIQEGRTSNGRFPTTRSPMMQTKQNPLIPIIYNKGVTGRTIATLTTTTKRETTNLLKYSEIKPQNI